MFRKSLLALTVLVGSLGHAEFSEMADVSDFVADRADVLARATTHRVRGADLARELDRLLTSMKMKLNNHGSQSSFVEVSGLRFGFQIPRSSVDLDCGWLCPDLGNAYFYVNDVNLQRADVSWATNALRFSLGIEGSGREIKGYHSVLGDNGMTDFDLTNISLTVKAQPMRTAQGRIRLNFVEPHLYANIRSTGACHIAGIDVCNRIFGTDRKVQKSVEAATVAALNGGLVQTALTEGIRRYLASIGIDRPILSVQVQGGDIVLTVQ